MDEYMQQVWTGRLFCGVGGSIIGSQEAILWGSGVMLGKFLE
jgi:hypothetical protein